MSNTAPFARIDAALAKRLVVFLDKTSAMEYTQVSGRKGVNVTETMLGHDGPDRMPEHHNRVYLGGRLADSDFERVDTDADVLYDTFEASVVRFNAKS